MKVAGCWLLRRLPRCALSDLVLAMLKSPVVRLGADLEGLRLRPPFDETPVPIVLGEHVTTDAGTGCVHTAPAHGLEDFDMGRRYDLEVYNPVGGNGVYHADTPVFAGKHIFKANDDIVAALSERDVLLCHEPFQHSYPHCWRHKTPIIFRATPQWFISMSGTAARRRQRSGRECAMGAGLGQGTYRRHACRATRLVHLPVADMGCPSHYSSQNLGRTPPRHPSADGAGGRAHGNPGHRCLV